jgi:hypothetical protein
MHVQAKSTHFVSLRQNDRRAAGHTTRTDSCSRHTREGRRGGHEQRRAHSSSVRSACPTASPTTRCSRRGRTDFHPRTTPMRINFNLAAIQVSSIHAGADVGRPQGGLARPFTELPRCAALRRCFQPDGDARRLRVQLTGSHRPHDQPFASRPGPSSRKHATTPVLAKSLAPRPQENYRGGLHAQEKPSTPIAEPRDCPERPRDRPRWRRIGAGGVRRCLALGVGRVKPANGSGHEREPSQRPGEPSRIYYKRSRSE